MIELHKSLLKSKADISEQTQQIVNDTNYILSYDLPENYITSSLLIVDETLSEHDLIATGVDVITDNFEQSVTYWIQTTLSPEKTVELNINLCKKLAKSELDVLLFDSFTIMFRAAA